MEYTQAFRDPELAKKAIKELHRVTTRDWVIMEICGGQTHAIMQYGIDQLIPKQIELVHGPGCPVCVTPLELIDKALAIAAMPNVIFTSFGDMLRVPGTNGDLFSVRAAGGDVRTVYSPLDAVKIARENPDKEVVFFAIGFETTAAPNVMSVVQAEKLGLKNYSILVSHALVPPAMHAILSSPLNRVQGFLAAGHVNTIMGYWQYPPVAEKYRIPITITGFEPLDLLTGILETVRQLEAGTHEVHNAYPRVVTYEGNQPAQKMIDQVYEITDRQWRGIGVIPQSGWKLRDTYAAFDAEKKFSVGHIQTEESKICIAGEILQGRKKPDQCPAFGTLCTPRTPLGATMVSSEGTCAAYFRFARNRNKENA
ncbi:MAG: hydrogenase formation protein HypD [Anaerolineaceae bacterium]|nr:hydrogenase formation protein HypD [Anaerolineaceae bacterium]